MQLIPLIIDREPGLAVGIQLQIDFIQRAPEALLGDITKLVTRQSSDRLPRRAQIKLTLQRVTGCRGAIQVTALNIEGDISIGRLRLRIGFQGQRHAFRQKILDVERPLPLQVVTGIQPQLPVTGHRRVGQREPLLIKTVLRLPDKGTHHLTIGLDQLGFHRLGRQRFAVGIP